MKQIFVTVKDYADNNNITEKTVYNRIKSGVIPKEKVKKVLKITLIEKSA